MADAGLPLGRRRRGRCRQRWWPPRLRRPRCAAVAHAQVRWPLLYALFRLANAFGAREQAAPVPAPASAAALLAHSHANGASALLPQPAARRAQPRLVCARSDTSHTGAGADALGEDVTFTAEDIRPAAAAAPAAEEAAPAPLPPPKPQAEVEAEFRELLEEKGVRSVLSACSEAQAVQPCVCFGNPGVHSLLGASAAGGAAGDALLAVGARAAQAGHRRPLARGGVHEAAPAAI